MSETVSSEGQILDLGTLSEVSTIKETGAEIKCVELSGSWDPHQRQTKRNKPAQWQLRLRYEVPAPENNHGIRILPKYIVIKETTQTAEQSPPTHVFLNGTWYKVVDSDSHF